MSDPAFEGNLASSAMGALPMKTASFRSIAEGLNGRPLAEPLLEAAMQRYSRPQLPASEVTIAFGLDTAYLPHAAVVLASLIANAPGAKLRFLIVHDGIPPQARSTFERCAEGHRFDWLEIKGSSVLAMPGKRHISRAGYYRLMLAELAPPDIDRVLYLDADLVVMGDIRELYASDLGEHAIGAVCDVGWTARCSPSVFSCSPSVLATSIPVYCCWISPSCAPVMIFPKSYCFGNAHRRYGVWRSVRSKRCLLEPMETA
ncbi:hypothetical protein AJ87_44335 [Rhizobium yanglingense]|nr:hypothetical protein AJ87_44335 [Rhizobium yanglingense]